MVLIFKNLKLGIVIFTTLACSVLAEGEEMAPSAGPKPFIAGSQFAEELCQRVSTWYPQGNSQTAPKKLSKKQLKDRDIFHKNCLDRSASVALSESSLFDISSAVCEPLTARAQDTQEMERIAAECWLHATVMLELNPSVGPYAPFIDFRRSQFQNILEAQMSFREYSKLSRAAGLTCPHNPEICSEAPNYSHLPW